MLLSATLVAFDAVTHTATLRESAALTGTRSGVPVSRAIAAAEMVVGRRLALAVAEGGPVAGEMVVGVY